MYIVHCVAWARDLDNSHLRVKILVSNDSLDFCWCSAGAFFIHQDLVFMSPLATESSLNPTMCGIMSIAYAKLNSVTYH